MEITNLANSHIVEHELVGDDVVALSDLGSESV